MTPNRILGPTKDSIAANPEAARLITKLLATGVIKKGDKPGAFYTYPAYKAIFASLNPEKFRKRLRKVMLEKYGAVGASSGSVASLARATKGDGDNEEDEDDSDDDEDPAFPSRAALEFGGGAGSELLSPVTEHNPIYVMGKWRDPRTRDGRVSLLVVLPTGILERADGISATVEDGWFVHITFVWPSVLTNATKVMDAVLQGCVDMDVTHGTLLAQGLMDYTDRYQKKEGDTIRTTCRIPLPFQVKPDFTEEVLGFDDTAVQLYLLRFNAPERNFAHPQSRFKVRTVTSKASRTANTEASIQQPSDAVVSNVTPPIHM